MRHLGSLTKKLGQFSASTQVRLARSSRAFLAGLLVACGVEVAVDWNSTLTDVAALRARMAERGKNYVGVLSRSLADPMAAHDDEAIARLTAGLLDDEDVVLVRVVDGANKTAYEKLVPEYADRFARERGTSFTDFYGHQLERDAKGMLADPESLHTRLANSRHRDFAQAYDDFIASLGRRFAGSAQAAAKLNTRVLYQDRLYDAKRDYDPTVTYGLGRIEGASPAPLGVVFVVFSMDRTNVAIRGKYAKGAALVAFFVGLILVQNLLSRREKLRLLDLDARYATAKEAIRAALPKPSPESEPRVAGAIAQAASTVDGVIWDVFRGDGGVEIVMADPQGEGVEAASVALHVQAAFRARRGAGMSLLDEVRALGEAALQIPLSRPLGVMIVRLVNDRLEGIASAVGSVRVVSGARSTALDASPIDEEVPAGIVGPLVRLQGERPAGARVVIVADGLKEGAKGVDPEAVVAFLDRVREGRDPEAEAADAVTWARGKNPALARNDLLVVTISPRG